MTAVELLETVKAAGGHLWTSDGNRIHGCLPASLVPLMDGTRLAKHTVDGSLGEWVGYFSLLAAYVAGVSCSRL